MANAELSIRIKDGQGQRASTRAFVTFPDAATAADLSTGLAAWMTALNNVTGGVVEEILANIFLDTSGLTANTPSGAIVAREGVGMSYPNATDNHPWTFWVPARAVATVASNKAVTTEGGLLDLLTDIMGAAFQVVDAGDSHFTDEDYNHLTLEPYCFPSPRQIGKRVRGPNRSLGV